MNGTKFVKHVRIDSNTRNDHDSEVVSTTTHALPDNFDPLSKADNFYDFQCPPDFSRPQKSRVGHKHHKYISELRHTLEGAFKGHPEPARNEFRESRRAYMHSLEDTLEPVTVKSRMQVALKHLIVQKTL